MDMVRNDPDLPFYSFLADDCQSIVISIFAIVILSILGSLFSKNHHSVMGSEDDPEDGSAVAGAVFGAVGIYGVSFDFPKRPFVGAKSNQSQRSSLYSAAVRHSYIKERGDEAPLHCRNLQSRRETIRGVGGWAQSTALMDRYLNPSRDTIPPLSAALYIHDFGKGVYLYRCLDHRSTRRVGVSCFVYTFHE